MKNDSKWGLVLLAAISFVALVTLVSYRNEPKKMIDLLCCNLLILLSIAPLPTHGRKWVAGIQDACAGWPRTVALSGVADVDSHRRRHCCPLRPHPDVRILQWWRRGFFPPWLPSQVPLFPPLLQLLLPSLLLLLLLQIPFSLEAEAPAAAVVAPGTTATYPAPHKWERRMPAGSYWPTHLW